ncbi:MAG: SgcJ/EcaC family oxidoreductase [Rhizobiales bacterium]|nr:SgcJ/EcaC family oxidoreductase [Hyphomicrobiales bacterium]
MFTVASPEQMNETFVRAFNTRDIANLLALYEDDAILCVDGTRSLKGKADIAAALGEFLQMPGTLTGGNNFCLRHDDVALLRADWTLIGPDGATTLAGSSAEIVRRQADGTWLYIVDHAVGASLERVG